MVIVKVVNMMNKSGYQKRKEKMQNAEREKKDRQLVTSFSRRKCTNVPCVADTLKSPVGLVEQMEMREPLPDPQPGFHGVLRYRKESEWEKNTLLVPSVSDHTVWCEFCGAKAKPPLGFSKTPEPKDFCCARYKETFKKMEQHWRLMQGQQDSGESSQEHDSSVHKNRHKARAQDVLHKVAKESLKKPKRLSSGHTETEMPGCKVTTSGMLTTIAFRLSDFVRMKPTEHLTVREDDIREERMSKLSKLGSVDPSSFPTGFGLRHFQGHNVQKSYKNGNKFLTVLPDGTAQVFYPSGNLAIITFIDDTQGVCIVLDDTESSCPIRAFFQSSGIAICYHVNGSTWLRTDMWGGQSLNENRSRSRKWKWTDDANIPTPFKPIDISLNKNIGVRVRGRETVLITFLALGQQAHFSGGSCTKIRAPPATEYLSKDELMVQVSQLNARLALERLRWCLSVHSDSMRVSLRLPAGLIAQGQRLLKLSSSVWMEENDRAYIQHCLRDCQ